MNERQDIFLAIAELLDYPGPGIDIHLRARTAARAASTLPEVAGPLALFEAAMSTRSAPEAEELFTRTFDVNPACCLEIGWQLHGETYDRGGLLVELRALMRDHGVAESTELPDHLSNVIRLLAALEAGKAADLAEGKVLPAIDRMLEGFSDSSNPYRCVIAGARAAIETMTKERTHAKS